MKRTYILSIATVFLVANFEQTSGVYPLFLGCSQGYTLNGTICYKYFTQCLSWTAARLMCQQHNGSLYKISDDISFRLAQALNDVNFKARGGNICTGGSWLGATLVDGVYRWEDGTLAEGPDYDSYYNTGQPDRLGSEACIEIRYSYSNHLNDHYCSSSKPFICQSDSYICSPGWQGDNCADDVDECGLIAEACPESNHICINVEGSYLCECMNGFGKQDNNTCNDINECENGTDGCGSICINTQGSYFCACTEGLRVDTSDVKLCRDINECNEASHNCTHTCENTYGGFQCNCRQGYTFDVMEWSCVKDDDADDACANQDPAIDCSNFAGCNNDLLECFCNNGYELSFDGLGCDDIDECSRHLCPQNCSNLLGTYECVCHAGYQLVDRTMCKECESPNYGMNCEQTCVCSSRGTVKCDSVRGCVCNVGWQGVSCDDDIDECLIVANACDDSKKYCVNTEGSYRCECIEGYYEYRNGTCLDVNECSNPILNTCSQLCSNTIGGYTCECTEGFTKHVNTCQDIDECALGISGCGQICYNLPGLHNCYCHFGFKLNEDRKTCQKVLFQYGPSAGDVEMKNTRKCGPAIIFPQGIPVYGKLHMTLYVCSNGYVSFDTIYLDPNPPKNLPADGQRTILAPFYASALSSGKVYYRVLDLLTDDTLSTHSDVTQVETLINTFGDIDSFSAKFILVSTWQNMEPYSATLTPNRTSTFQMILASDGVDTYVIYVYGRDEMKWTIVDARHSGDVDVFVGIIADGTEKYKHPYSYQSSILRMDISASSNGITGLVTQRLTANNDRTRNYAVECINWYSANKADTFTIERIANRLPDCPCNTNFLRQDPWFGRNWRSSGNISCIDAWPSPAFSHHGKVCCYDNGLWTQEVPYAGGFNLYHPWTYPREHTEHDINTKETCCEKSDNCHLYYELRPIGTCYRKTWFDLAVFWGDPHFLTLDGKTFIFNGLGEYTLLQIRTENVTFDLQARTRRAVKEDGNLSYATLFSAFAAKDNFGASFHIELNGKRNGMNIYGNGADLTNKFKSKGKTPKDDQYIPVNGNISIYRDDNDDFGLSVSFLRSDVSFNVAVGAEMLSLRATVSKSYKGLTQGLLGNFDDVPENDFIQPDGTHLSANMGEQDIFYYGQRWEIDASNSAFEYEAGKSHSDYHNVSFVPKFLEDMPQTIVDKAVNVCKGIENLACVFDYAFTEDENISTNTKQTGTSGQAKKTAMNKTVSQVSACDVIKVTVGELATCEIQFNENEVVEFHFIDNISSNLSVDWTSRSITYVADLNPVKIRLSAINRDGMLSPAIFVPIYLCTGCSKHGICSNAIRTDPMETSYFKYRTCICEHQYDGIDCEKDFDGCASKPCSLGRECLDVPATNHTINGPAYICGECPDGLYDDDEKCADINECENGTDGCGSICINTQGSYFCACTEGLRVDKSDVKLCRDINECEEAIHNCTQICENTYGGFQCNCHRGYTFDVMEWSCVKDDDADDACANQGTDLDCSNFAGCKVNDNGLTECFCNNGYEITSDGLGCDDIDECSRHVCPQNCSNSLGTYECVCYAGYQLVDRTMCKECESPNYGMNCEQTCVCSSRGTVKCDSVRGCVCNVGWQGVSCDDDIDECLIIANACDDSKKYCVNTDGSYRCECIEGYYEYRNGTCLDVNECSNPILNTCSQLCSNTIGGYTCECTDGFTKHDNTCQDIDECVLGISGCEQICYNLPGLHNCYCHSGFTLNDDRKTCQKVSDPCQTISNLTCDHHCVISDDNKTECTCRTGFHLENDTQTCADINECESDVLNLCSPKETCRNTEGSFSCDCLIGTKLENDDRTCTECDKFHYGKDCSQICTCHHGTCDMTNGCLDCDQGWIGKNCDIDEDECVTHDAVCSNFGDQHVKCVNTPGSFKCACVGGYTNSNTSGSCKDVDECSDVKLNDCDQICINTGGSFTCSCQEGFIHIHDVCIDIDECMSIAECDQICDNTLGSYRCSCEPGFRLNLVDRKTCIPEQECSDDQKKTCPEYSTCVVQNSRTECNCIKGYINDTDGNCIDIDECTTNTHTCSQNCSNSLGGYTCSCATGYFLLKDGITCQLCQAGYFGNNCEAQCQCSSANTQTCDPSSGHCTCLKGWSGTQCDQNIDECDTGNFTCPSNSNCNDVDGGYDCICELGYIKSGKGACEKCNSRRYGLNCRHECQCVSEKTLHCDNRNGTCICEEGWTGNACADDVNECTTNAGVCDDKPHSSCENLNGTFTCNCDAGFLEQEDSCVDIDECITFGEHRASCLQVCENTVGNYTCRCDRGYTGVWNNCTVCDGNTFGDNCSEQCNCNISRVTNANQTCHVTTGLCFCNALWTGYGCEVDVNECVNTTICREKANTGCHNIVEGYRCDCKRGFKMESGGCVLDADMTTQSLPIGDNNIVLHLEVTIYTELPAGTDLEVTTTYDDIKQTVTQTLVVFLSEFVSVQVQIIINNMRIGSLVVDFTIVLGGSNEDDIEKIKTNLTLAFVTLARNASATYDGKQVIVFLDGSRDLCTAYEANFGHCEDDKACLVENDAPLCKSMDKNDNVMLIVGASIGACALLMVVAIFVICIKTIRTTQNKKKEAAGTRYKSTGVNKQGDESEGVSTGQPTPSTFTFDQSDLPISEEERNLTWKTMATNIAQRGSNGRKYERPFQLPRAKAFTGELKPVQG